MAGKIHNIVLPLLILCFTISPGTTRSQPVHQIRMGEQVAMKDSWIYPKLFRNSGSLFLLSFRDPDFLLCREGEPQYTIESFDTSLNHTGTFPVKTSLKDYNKLEPLFLDFTENTFFVFATETSATTGTARSLAFRLTSGGELQVPPVNLGELSGLGKSSQILFSAKKDNYFSVARFHDDSATVFLYTQQFPVQNQPTAKLMVKVLDTGLSLIKHKILNLAVPPEYCEFSNILLAKGGLFFILTIQIPFEDRLFKLVTYNFEKDELSYFDFSMEGKKIHSLETVMLEKGNILIRGLYADPSSKEEVDGLLYFLFDTDNQTLLSSGSVKIPAGQKEMSGKELDHLQIREAFVRPNGDVVILSELYWTEVINFSDSEGKLYLRPYYHSDDLLILYFSKTGTWKWHVWIPREFASGSEEMLGFHSLMTDSVAYIIYNDHPDNMMTYDPGRIKRVKGNSMPVLAMMDMETGVYYKYPFSDRSVRNLDFAFRKEYSYNTSSRSMIWIITDGFLYLMQTTFGSEGTSSTKRN